MEFLSYTLDDQLIPCNNNSVCNLQIVDTAGSYCFPAMQRLNISKGRAFIMVYSVTSRQSLEQLESTWKTIREIKVYIFPPPILLLLRLYFAVWLFLGSSVYLQYIFKCILYDLRVELRFFSSLFVCTNELNSKQFPTHNSPKLITTFV